MRPRLFFSLLIGIFLLPLVSLGKESFQQEFKTKQDFTICLPENWRDVPGDILKQINQKMGEMTHVAQHWEYAYQLKSAEHWLAYPYILVEFKPGRKSEAAFKKELNIRDKMQEGIDEASKKTSSLLTGAKIGDTSYNPATHTLESLSEFNVQGFGMIKAYTALKLTEKGCIQFCGYCKLADEEKFIPFYKDAVEHIKLSSDMVYQPNAMDGVPIFGSIHWDNALQNGIVGGIIGGLVALIVALFKKKRAS